MSTPSITLSFRKIRGDLPTYGYRYEDVSRKGVNGHRWKYIGTRGNSSTFECIAFYRTAADARTGASGVTSAQGNEIFLRSTLDAWAIRCFLVNATISPPQKIESSQANDNYRVTYRLEVIRTS